MIKLVAILGAIFAVYFALSYVLRTWAGSDQTRQMVVGAVAGALAFGFGDFVIGEPATLASAVRWLIIGGVAGAASAPLIGAARTRLLGDQR